MNNENCHLLTTALLTRGREEKNRSELQNLGQGRPFMVGSVQGNTTQENWNQYVNASDFVLIPIGYSTEFATLRMQINVATLVRHLYWRLELS